MASQHLARSAAGFVPSPLVRRYDRERVLVTPEGVQLPITLASRGNRAAALMLDLFFIGTLMVVSSLILIFVFAGIDLDEFARLEQNDAIPAPFQVFLIIWIILMFLFRQGYFLFFELGARGATWGKRIMGIRVASRDGGRLTTEAVIARNIVRDIELFIPMSFFFGAMGGALSGWGAVAGLGWLGIFLFFPFFNANRLRCGDLIAGTFVVERPKAKLNTLLATHAAAQGQSAQAGASYKFTEAELAVYGEYELQVLEEVLRNNIPASIIEVHATICGKIGWNPGAGDERAFLEAYYTQLRARLETGMRFGTRKADKYSDAQ